MTRYEILSFNKELLRRLSDVVSEPVTTSMLIFFVNTQR